MKTMSQTLIALSLIGLFAAGGQAAERHTSVTGPNGKTATRDVLRQDGDVSSTTTGPNGKTGSRVVDRSASGTAATVTGPNGKVVKRTTTRQP
ncbi:MAG TPA: hypothetical protein VLJ58_11515 [Ramlibacter sp.]|nr:hypothetical protein [Ramlibacter sp.]